MPADPISDAYLRFDTEITHASGDRAELKRIRCRIRAAALDSDDRAELLERAKYTPGCFPPEIEIEAPPYPSLAYRLLLLKVADAVSDRRRLQRLRRQIRDEEWFDDENERQDLLEHARWQSGRTTLDVEEWLLQPLTHSEITGYRWASQSEGGLRVLTEEQADEMLSQPGAIDLRPKPSGA